MRVLPEPAYRGHDLGLFNLTNTVPRLIMPWLTVTVVPARGFPALFGILALLAFTSSALLFTLKRLDWVGRAQTAPPGRSSRPQ